MLKLKNYPLILSLLFSLSFLVACNDDMDDGILPSTALTTYTGTLVYSPAVGEVTTTVSGTATISLVRNEYNIDFSDNVPSVIGLTFVESDGDFTTGPGADQTVLTIDGDELTIASFKDLNSWSFNGSK